MSGYLTLTRARLSAFTGIAAFMGHTMGAESLTTGSIYSALGVYLLASGASALNQIAERDLDILMERTKKRPLPSGTMSLGAAWLVTFLLLASGLGTIIKFSSGPAAVLLSLGALVIYNGIYTPLKRLSGFAILVGALAGAMPTAIGWAMSGGAIASYQLAAVCLMFYLWQMPHFWMLLARYREDFERAGLPTPGVHLSDGQIRRVCLTWASATSASGLMLPLFGSGTGRAALTLILVASILLLVTGLLGVVSVVRRSYFVNTNIYILMIMLSIVSEAFYP